MTPNNELPKEIPNTLENCKLVVIIASLSSGKLFWMGTVYAEKAPVDPNPTKSANNSKRLKLISKFVYPEITIEIPTTVNPIIEIGRYILGLPIKLPKKFAPTALPTDKAINAKDAFDAEYPLTPIKVSGRKTYHTVQLITINKEPSIPPVKNLYLNKLKSTKPSGLFFS